MATYVCVQCGRRASPDKYTAIDARYTTGRCPIHKGKQYLVREDVDFTATTQQQMKLDERNKS